MVGASEENGPRAASVGARLAARSTLRTVGTRTWRAPLSRGRPTAGGPARASQPELRRARPGWPGARAGRGGRTRSGRDPAPRPERRRVHRRRHAQRRGRDLWAATEKAYSAIVLDIMLPKVNGYQVVERLRDEGNWTPILMLTAKDGDYDQTDAFDLGADDYLTKPFSFIVLDRPTPGPDPARRSGTPGRARRRRSHPRPGPAACAAGGHGAGPHAPRVRAVGVPAAPPWGHRDQGTDPRRRMGSGVRRRTQRRRGLHPLPAPQDRPAVRPSRHRDRTRQGYRLAPDGG